MQEIEATVVDGNGTETGHIIATTIGGRNGQPKQVGWRKCTAQEGGRVWASVGGNGEGNGGADRSGGRW